MKFLILPHLLILLILSIISTPLYSKTLKTYKVDMRFLNDQSKINIDQQSSDVLPLERELLAASDEEAILDFGDKKIRLHLIGSQHDIDDDYYYLKQCLMTDQISLDSTLFIEQGDSLHGATKSDYITLADDQSSETKRLMKSIWITEENYLGSAIDEGPFSMIDRFWKTEKRVTANIDLAENYSNEALAFIHKNVSLDIARYFYLDRFDLATSNLNSSEKIAFSDGFLPISDHGLGTDLKSYQRNQYRHFSNLLRERFMRLTLFKNAKDGDVVILHPYHLKNILNLEAR